MHNVKHKAGNQEMCILLLIPSCKMLVKSLNLSNIFLQLTSFLSSNSVNLFSALLITLKNSKENTQSFFVPQIALVIKTNHSWLWKTKWGNIKILWKSSDDNINIRLKKNMTIPFSYILFLPSHRVLTLIIYYRYFRLT